MNEELQCGEGPDARYCPKFWEVSAERDKAYGERAALVAYLSATYPSVMLTDSAEPDWPIVFVSTPSGQMSWHVAKADLGLFAHVPATTNPTWDGHTTEQKYERLAELTRTVATGIYGPQVTPTGYQGPAAHTYTAGCPGHHPITEPCPPAAKPVIIVFDINEGIQGWFRDLADAVREQSGGKVIITDVDAEMSDVMIAVADREIDSGEALAIWSGDDDFDGADDRVDFGPRADREAGQ